MANRTKLIETRKTEHAVSIHFNIPRTAAISIGLTYQFKSYQDDRPYYVLYLQAFNTFLWYGPNHRRSFSNGCSILMVSWDPTYRTLFAVL